MATQKEIKSFIILLGGLAVNECNRRIKNGEGFILPSVCIAQSALETGWGTADLMKEANAFFGIKAGGSWTGKSFSANTKEVYNGQEYNVRANFRAYDSLADSVKDYYDLLLGASRYAKAVSYYPDKVLSASKTVREIANAGYATDELYYSKVYDKITYRDLTTWDKQIDGITVVDDADGGYSYIPFNDAMYKEDSFTKGALYVNNSEVLVDETTNTVSLMWAKAIPMKKGTYTIVPPKGYKLKVIALSGETFETFETESAWSNAKSYDKVAFTMISLEHDELTMDEKKLAVQLVEVSMSNPNYKPVGDRILASFIKI